MGTIEIDGATPKLTIGNATAEDATILFDGNAQDFYIALDDSADDLLIGLGSTVGTTPAIAIDENLKVNIPVTTASTSASTGSLTTGGGAGIGADLYVGDDVYLITDSAVLGFGADKDTLLTHTDGTGLTLNSTNKLCFNDTSQFVQGISATVLGLGATDEIDLTATAVDLNGTLNVSGVATFQATPVFPDGSLALADLDIDGGTEIGAAIVDADLFIIDDGAGGTNRKVTASRLLTYAGFTATTITGTTALAEQPASDDEIIISDGGTLKRLDFDHIYSTPSFYAYQAATQTIGNGSQTKVTLGSEGWDTGSAFASNAWTPGVVGKYYIVGAAYLVSVTVNGHFQISFYKNGAQIPGRNGAQRIYQASTTGASIMQTSSFVIELDDDDYIEMYVMQDNTDGGGGDRTLGDANNLAYMAGWKIIGI